MTTENSTDLSPNEQTLARREKLKKLREKGLAYPNKFRRDTLAHDLFVSYGSETTENLKEKNKLNKIDSN